MSSELITKTRFPNSFSQTALLASGTMTDDQDGFVKSDTIRDRIDKMADAHPDQRVYIYPHNGTLELTYSEMRSRVYKIASGLADLGVRSGDRVAFLVANSHEHALGVLACGCLGATCVLLDYVSFKFQFVRQILTDTSAKVLFMFDSYNSLDYDSVLNQMDPLIFDSFRFPNLQRIVLIRGNSGFDRKGIPRGGLFTLYEDLLNSSYGNHQFPEVDSNEPFVIIFTSGTSGSPKGIVHSQISLLNNLRSTSLVLLKSYSESSRNGIFCSTSSLNYIGGLCFSILLPLVAKCTTVIPYYAFNVEKVLDAIVTYHCDQLSSYPQYLLEISDEVKAKGLRLSSLKYVSSGATPVPVQLIRTLLKDWSLLAFFNCYGMSETSCLNHINVIRADTSERLTASIGRPLPFTEAKVVNEETGQICEIGQTGILHVRSPGVMKRYWNQPDLTKQFIDEEGWFKTNDYVEMGKDGYLFYKSRVAEVIMKNGRIFPSEIEAVLNNHPAVRQSTVFGIRIDEYDSHLCTWIVLKPSFEATVQEIREYLRARLVEKKVPQHYKLVSEFPRNSNNKIDKSKIIALFKTELEKKCCLKQ